MIRPRAFRDDPFGTVFTAALLLLTVFFGARSALRYPPWSPVDEGAHFHFVQVVAEKFRLPVIEELTSNEVLAIGEHVYPERSRKDPRRLGLGGRSYEAFQAPLYYLLAAPVYRLASDHRDKVRDLRLFGVLLLVATFVPLALLARDLVGPAWPSATGFSGLYLFLPGVLFRNGLVSNDVLALPLGATLIWLLVRAADRDLWRDYLCACLVFGLCLATKVTLLFFGLPVAIVGLALWWRRRCDPRAAAILVLSAVLALVPLAPWMARNLSVYGAPMANDRAKAMSDSIINPTGAPFTLADVRKHLSTLARFPFPQEDPGPGPVPHRETLASLLVAVLVLAPPLVGFRRWRPPHLLVTAVLASALPAGIVLVATLSMREDQLIMLPRYLHAALPGWGLFAFLAYRDVLPASAVRALATAALIASVALWIDLAGTMLS